MDAIRNCQNPLHLVPRRPIRETVFKRDETAVLPMWVQHAEYNVQIIDPAKPSMSKEFNPESPQMQLFFVFGAGQTLQVWIVTNSGSVRNLIDKALYLRLPNQHPY